MADQSDMIRTAMDWLDRAADLATGWLMSPAAWSQFALLAVAYLAARLADARLSPLIRRLATPPEGKSGLIATARLFALRFLPLLLPLLAYGLTAGGKPSRGRCSDRARSLPLASGCSCSWRRAPLCPRC